MKRKLTIATIIMTCIVIVIDICILIKLKQKLNYNPVDDLDMQYLVVNISYYTDTHDKVTLRCLLDSDTHTMGDLVETTVSRNNLHIGDTIKMCY